ncbi:hypothetical protein VK70_07255 [Paenibacillus durus ATCC 35681]|uniref:F5/8 type C domain-containing protein n=2 Tax=Paenibacillus durus TaxID=44251 RepID=A0A0F7CI91_PAEDU|nr:hypothetical protein VK70_07255 [Paenibacillus durus ATCC 35681]
MHQQAVFLIIMIEQAIAWNMPLTILGNVTYYLYDRNGNLKRKLASTSFPVFASSSLEGWETYKLGDSNVGTVWSSEAQGTENDVQWIALDGGHS